MNKLFFMIIIYILIVKCDHQMNSFWSDWSSWSERCLRKCSRILGKRVRSRNCLNYSSSNAEDFEIVDYKFCLGKRIEFKFCYDCNLFKTN